eukprot:6936418-Heterocapsa_arctica.AAC.1
MARIQQLSMGMRTVWMTTALRILMLNALARHSLLRMATIFLMSLKSFPLPAPPPFPPPFDPFSPLPPRTASASSSSLLGPAALPLGDRLLR